MRVTPRGRLLFTIMGCLFMTTTIAAGGTRTPQSDDLDLMRSQIARREYQEAESVIGEYLHERPDAAEAWELLGRARHGRWDFEGAAAAYRRALDLGRENAGLLRGWVETKGRSSGNISLFFTAGSLRRDLERALELDPLDVEARAFLAAFYYMVPRMLGGDKREATRIVSELVDLSPPDGYYLLGVRAKEEDEPERVVLGYWEQAIGLDPMHTLTLIELGRYWMDHGDQEKALDLYRHAVESAPGDPRILTSFGRALRSGGRQEESAAQYRRALEIDPFWAEARFGLAEYHERIGEHEAARREYRLLLRNNPTWRNKEIRRRIEK